MRIKTGFNLKKASLFAFPLAYLFASQILKAIRGPYWFEMNFDPEYAYLFNGVRIDYLLGPWHIDHPGTPLQLLIALILKVTHMFLQVIGRTNRDLDFAVFASPEKYLSLVNIVLALLGCIMIFYTGYFVFRRTNNLVSAYLLQITPFLSVSIFAWSARVSPEPLLFIIIQGFVLSIVYTLDRQGQVSKKTYGLMGILLGVGVATKINLLPLLVIPLFINSAAGIAIVYLAALLGFVVSTLPILDQYPRLFDWVRNITTHTGIYGFGDTGFMDLSLSFISGKLTELVTAEKLTVLLLGISTVLLAVVIARCLVQRNFRKTWSENHLLRLWVFVSIAATGQLVITLKHFRVHYLLPAFALVGLLVFIQFTFFKQTNGFIKISGLALRTDRLLFGLLLAAAIIQTAAAFQAETLSSAALRNDLIQIARSVQKENDAGQVYYYRSSSPEYALSFGNDWSAGRFGATLKNIYPGRIFYDIWRGVYYTYTGQVEQNKLPFNKILLQGSASGPNRVEYRVDQIEVLYAGKTESLFSVEPQKK